MKTQKTLKLKSATIIVCLGLLSLATSASATVVVTGASQDNASTFTPTWTVAPSSGPGADLIHGLLPSTYTGSTNGESSAGGLPCLTDGIIGPVQTTTTFTIEMSCGNNSADGCQELIYTLPASSTGNGFNLTNITTYSSWQNGGRIAQGYTVYYSTVAAPSTFIEMTTVDYDPFSGNSPSEPVALQVQVADSTGGTIAANVYAVEFLFTSPVPPNGFNSGSGYSEITIQGNASPFAAPVITTSTQTGTAGATANQALNISFTPVNWPLESYNLISGVIPIIGAGNYSEESAGREVDTLTQGGGLTMTTIENATDSGATTSVNYVTLGYLGGNLLTYVLPTNSLGSGVDVTNIAIYNGWADNGRDGQNYNVYYSSVSNPTNFILITPVTYLPVVSANTEVANRVGITGLNNLPLASNVYALMFNFANTYNANGFNNNFQGYAQFVVQGTNSAAAAASTLDPVLVQDILPTSATTVQGDQVVFTAVVSGTPSCIFQWQQVVSGVTNNLSSSEWVNTSANGVITSALTLNNVQTPGSAGSYLLAVTNASNPSDFFFTSAATLTVNPAPTPVGNIVVSDANQTGWGEARPIDDIDYGTNFSTTWTINTTADLIYQSYAGSGPGTYTYGAGNFDADGVGGNLNNMVDGSFGYLSFIPNVGSSPTAVACGVSPGGESITYTLPLAANGNGWDITNITVYGGWGDDGRDEQKYQILYSTVGNETNFISLINPVDYNPPEGGNTQQCATRVTVTPATGALAHSVYAVQFNFNLQGAPPKNGVEGYNQFVIGGTNSAPVPVLTQDITPDTAEDVLGSAVTMTAAFSNYTSLQWMSNGMPLTGANSPSLTLSPLAASYAASYNLVAYNNAGSSASSSCTLTVDPAPSPVGNIVTAYAYQTSDAGSFSPTWDTSLIGSSANLIWNQYPPGVGYDTVDSFINAEQPTSASDSGGGLYILTDGNYGALPSDGTHPAFAVCGNDTSIAGHYVIYLMPDSGAYGDSITGIEVAGGWNDDGRDSQYYTISYSTVESPTNFTVLTAVANNLADYGVNDKTVVRTTITPVSGLLASNVYAVYVDFTTPAGVPNGFSGYSQISVFGSASSAPPPTLLTDVTPLVSDVPVGAPMNFSVTAASLSPITYQWSNNSVMIGSQTSSNYSFAALPGSNYYNVSISNSAGVTVSSTALVIGETNSPPVLTLGEGTGWTLNTAAGSPFSPTITASNQIQLTAVGANGDGTSAFYNVGQYDGGFIASFWYLDESVGGADGTTFCLQNAPGGPSAIGASGGSLGYGGLTPSAAFELNIYTHTFVGSPGNTAGPGIMLGIDGAVDTTTNGLFSTAPVNIASGDFVYVQLVYLQGNLQVWVIDPSTGEFTTNYAENLPAILGNGSAYIGVTGADGGIQSSQYVTDFLYTYTTPPTLTVANGAAGSVIVSWPVSVSTLFQLQQTSTLNGPWTPVTIGTTNQVNLQNQVTLPTSSGGDMFYRLQLTAPFAPPYTP